jgi:hypothetical protein
MLNKVTKNFKVVMHLGTLRLIDSWDSTHIMYG